MPARTKRLNVLEIHSLEHRPESCRSTNYVAWDGDPYVAMLVNQLGVPVERHVVESRSRCRHMSTPEHASLNSVGFRPK